MTLTLSARSLRRVLPAIAVALTLLSLTARLLHPGSLASLLDVNEEMSYPNWYSSLGLAAASMLLWTIAWASRRSGKREFLGHWIFLGAVFALLSSDEIVGVHERVGAVLRRLGHFSGYLRFAWVIPAGVGLCFMGLAYLRFLAALPIRQRNLFLAAGAVYVSGALVLEMIGGKLADLYTWDSTVYVLCNHLEECLELCGVALFNAALVEHLAGQLGPDGLSVRFRAD